MILITTGTVTFPFKRLVDFAYSHYQSRTSEKLIIQTGYYQHRSSPKHIVIRQFLPHQQLVKYFQEARLIIAAAGEGTLLEIVHYSRHTPLLVPRLRRFNEHVDDQQLLTARAAKKRGYADYLINLSSERLSSFTSKPIIKRTNSKQQLVNQLHRFSAGVW